MLSLRAAFDYAFPFEGNWNSSGSRSDPSGRTTHFDYAFPFEGNWNCLDLLIQQFLWWFPLITLSRLKGIETFAMVRNAGKLLNAFDYAFPFEGNWNHVCVTFSSTLATVFDYAFPFEGNWNDVYIFELIDTPGNFDYAFPFEGNWNGRNPKRRAKRSLRKLWLRFPVWRELKHSGCERGVVSPLFFDYAFPFEGNWNPFSSTSAFRCPVALITLSRLKGIETLGRWTLPDEIHRFDYAFPFEGNWNESLEDQEFLVSSLITLSRLKGIETKAGGLGRVVLAPLLWLRFPVWRELKQCLSLPHERPMSLITLSRLKGIETRCVDTHSITPNNDFDYAFPFEGNWNPFRLKDQLRFISFDYAFPFEGNWNFFTMKANQSVDINWLWLRFPVWRELKLTPNNECYGQHHNNTLITLSRLKGIET